MKRGAWTLLSCAALAVLTMGAAKCAPPKLQPTKPPTPGPVTPTPGPVTPTPVACSIPDGPSAKGERLAPPPGFVELVNASAQRVAACPEGAPSRCTIVGPTMRAFLEAVQADLAVHGACSAIQDGADELCVRVAGDRCTGVHLYVSGRDDTHGTVGWAPGSIRDTWSGGTPATPRPDPEPTPAPTPKPDPTPPATGDATCPAGTPTPGKYVINCHVKPANPNAVSCDATPKVVSEREYCAPDLNCPYKGGEGSALREACERALAWPVWTGATMRDGGNPYLADAERGASITVCGRDAPGACGSVVAP